MKSVRRRKVVAVLAVGAVLGIGTTSVLANWNDSEFATGTFTAGQFNLQGSTTSATAGYSDHATAGAAATLSFSAPFNNLSPGSVTYASFWVQLDITTTSSATLVANAPTATGSAVSNLSYSVYSIPSASTCNATAVTTGTLVASGTTLTGFTAGAPVPLAMGTPGTAAGAPVQLCFVVTASSSLAQAQTATVTWSFTATSTV